MINDTIDYGHWVIDNYLEEKGFNRLKELTLDSIDQQISSQLKTFNDETENEFIEDFVNNKNITFKIVNPFKIENNKFNDYFKNSQDWIGIVEKFENNGFIAKLIDKNNEGTYEIAEFELNEVSKSDLNLVSIGAAFYFSIGFANYNGQIKKESFLRFKRNIPFNSNDIDNIENKIVCLEKNINWD